MATGARPQSASSKARVGGEELVENRPNSGPRTEAKPSASSCPLLQLICSENGPGRAGQRCLQNWRWSGGANGKQNPRPSPCSLPKPFPLSRDGGEWILAAQRPSARPLPCPGPCLGGLACPGHQQYQWHSHLSVPRSGRGENGAALPRALTLAFFLEETQNPRDSCTV